MSEMIRIEGAGRIDVGVADHELFEDVVLNGPGELVWRHALFFGRDDVERHHRQHRAVHGHRHRHGVERNAVEKLAHVEMESMATPAMPTSPATRGWSLS
jgi:hypothetical protein